MMVWLGMVELTAAEVEVWEKGLNYSLIKKIPIEKAKSLAARGIVRAVDFQTVVIVAEGGARTLRNHE